MNTKTLALTTAVLLAMGATVGAQANVNGTAAADIGLGFEGVNLADQSTINKETGNALEQNSTVAKRRLKPPKGCNPRKCK